jgi:hypothetical protein
LSGDEESILVIRVMHKVNFFSDVSNNDNDENDCISDVRIHPHGLWIHSVLLFVHKISFTGVHKPFVVSSILGNSCV